MSTELRPGLSGSQGKAGIMDTTWFSSLQRKLDGDVHLYIFVDGPGVQRGGSMGRGFRLHYSLLPVTLLSTLSYTSELDVF